MNIDKETWHYKLYRWWLEIKCKRVVHCNYNDEMYDFDNNDYIAFDDASDEFIHGRLDITPNLCLYIKVVLLYAPFRKAINNKVFQLISLNLGLLGVIVLEFVNSEFNELMFILGIVTGIIGILAGICFAIFILVENIKAYRESKLFTEKKPTFYNSIVKPYIKAKKSKICPFLTFE